MNRQERIDLIEWVVKHTLASGADQVAAALHNRREIEIEFRDRKLEKLTESVRNRLSLDIYTGHRFSGHSTNDLRKDALAGFIEEGVASTRYLAQDEFRELPDPKFYPAGKQKVPQIRDEHYETVETPGRVEIASEIEAVAMSESDKVLSTTSWFSDVLAHTTQMHSNGFLGEVEGTRYEAGAEVTVDDPGGGRPQDWSWAEVRFHRDLPSASELGREAVRRALRKIGQEKIETGRYDMIVENRVAQRLLRMFSGPMTARALSQKNSFLEGMVGESIASDKFTAIDDPLLPKGLGSRLFDGDGLAAKRRIMIEGGVLRQFYVDNYYGRKIGMDPTTGSPSNIVFETGARSLEEMIRDTTRAILVNAFIGGNSNSTTGDFSFGIVGLLIENGEITKPVNEMNISGNAKQFWQQLTQMGNDPDPYDSVRCPSMYFTDVQFSGI
jgi:PmbA protein